MFMLEYKATAWWYWLITVVVLTTGVAGWATGVVSANGRNNVQVGHFAVREGSITAFPVQVRAGYLTLLLIAFPEPLRSIYWIPVVGTWAQVLFGYCAMARTVSLLPWNRREPFSTALVMRTFFSAPVRGNVLQGLPPLPAGPRPNG
jgi:hypothetical protein